jgi:xylulokinase
MNVTGPLLLSFDLGTTAIKVGLFSAEGQLLKVASREQRLFFLDGDRIEQSPEETWELIVDATREVIQGFQPSEVKSIALSLQRGTVIPLDSDGQPLSDFIVWMDKRGIPITEEIETQIGLETYYESSGHPISYVTGVSKALWIQRYTNEIDGKISAISPPETFFLRRLGCEELVCTHSSGTYLFPFQIEKKKWSGEIAKALDFPLEILPKLVTSVEVVGKLSNQSAEEMGLPPGIPLVPGGGDGQCAAVGCGAIQPGRCMINIGTAAGVQTYLPHPLKDPNYILNCAAHVVPNGWEMEGHTQSSGAVFRWLRDELGTAELAIQRASNLDAFDLLIKQAEQAPPGCDGLLCLPLFNGSTAPIMDQQARGVVIGLSLAHKRGHLIRALLEGISLEIRWMLDAIAETGADIEEIRMVGGGARNPYWNQIHADILNRPVSTLLITDAAMVGSAMCGAVAIGHYQDLNEAAQNFIQIKDTIEPRPENQPLYASLYQNYQDTFSLLSDSGIFNQLKRQTPQP